MMLKQDIILVVLEWLRARFFFYHFSFKNNVMIRPVVLEYSHWIQVEILF